MKTIGDNLYHAEIHPDKQRETPQKAIQVYLFVLAYETCAFHLYAYIEIEDTFKGHQAM